MFKQFLDWMGSHDCLYSGGASDTEHFTAKIKEEEENNKAKGILKEQEEFQSEDLVDGEVECFYNILDKVFKVTREIFFA